MTYKEQVARRKRIDEICRVIGNEISRIIVLLQTALIAEGAELTEVRVGPPETEFSVTISST